jgi:hypothetical protein
MTPAALVGIAVGAFVSTNVDNFVVTTAQFAACGGLLPANFSASRLLS